MGFTLVDWSIIAAYLAMTTVVGALLAGKQATIRDFFLGGRKLPWWAISGSIVATEISAATIVVVPTLSFAAGGNFAYLQLALGSILARLLVARYFVPRFYEHEIYSPYDYVGERLGPAVKQATTGLFMLGAVLGQGARLYITAFVLSVIAGTSLPTSIWIIGAFAVGWTLMGGMTTVIWTDVIQCGVILIGAIVSLAYSVGQVPGGWGQVMADASAAGKLGFFELSTDPSMEYTLWCGLLAMPFLNLAAFGTDQVMAQRMFCCKDERDARKAILWSNLSLVIPFIMLWVGVALHSYFRHNPLSGAEAAMLAGEANKNNLLPVFLVRALPMGVRAIIVAAIFAAAISTLDGALTALAQSSYGAFAKWWKRGATEDGQMVDSGMRNAELGAARREVLMSKVATVFWGVALCLMAQACIYLAGQYKNAIDLALGLSAYLYGPLLGIFLLAFLRTGRDDAGLVWAVPMTVLALFGLTTHNRGADFVVWIGAAIFVALGLAAFRRDVRRLMVVAAGGAAIVGLHQVGFDAGGGSHKYLAFTWMYPIGTMLTFALGYLLGRGRAPHGPAGRQQGVQRGVRPIPRSSRPRPAASASS